jgi:hypothetical protein
MPRCRKQSLIFWGSLFLIFLSGCGPKIECDSIETRNALLQTVTNDHRNALANFAANNNSSKPEKPFYTLGQRMVTASVSADKQTLKCSGAISAAVGDTKASKEVTFTLQQAPDGKLSVSVDPFQF